MEGSRPRMNYFILIFLYLSMLHLAPPPPLPPPPSFNNKLIISKTLKDSDCTNRKKDKEENRPIMHNLLEELSRKTKDRPKSTGNYQYVEHFHQFQYLFRSPRTLRLSTKMNKRSFSGGGVSSPARSSIVDVNYIGMNEK